MIEVPAMNVRTSLHDCARWILERTRCKAMAIFCAPNGILTCHPINYSTEQAMEARPTDFVGVYGPGACLAHLIEDLECFATQHHHLGTVTQQLLQGFTSL